MKLALLLVIFALIIFLCAKRIERAFCHVRMYLLCKDCKEFLKKFVVINNFQEHLDKQVLYLVYKDLKNKYNIITDDLKILVDEIERKQ